MAQIKTILAENVKCDWENNKKARYEKPPLEYFASLATNIRENGQIAPVILKKKDKEKELEVEIGFCRREAMVILNRQERAEGKEEHQLTLMQYVLESEKLDSKAEFLKQISENGFRTKQSPMDYCVNIIAMADEYGMTQAEIADFFGFQSQGSVSGYKSLYKLSPNLQKQVHTGEISYTHALSLLKEPEATRESLVEALKAKDGKVTNKGIKEGSGSGNPKELSAKERNPVLPSGPPKGEDMVPKFVKSPTDLHTLLMKLEKKAEKDPKYLTSEASMVLSRVLSWFKGRFDDEYLRVEINKLCPEKEDVIEEEEEKEGEN